MKNELKSQSLRLLYGFVLILIPWLVFDLSLIVGDRILTIWSLFSIRNIVIGIVGAIVSYIFFRLEKHDNNTKSLSKWTLIIYYIISAIVIVGIWLSPLFITGIGGPW
jgi:uncharacterized membrane protein YeaQ/YmgE (transglycosylase-associated protein family)